MTFVFPPPPQASVAVAGSTSRFPVRRVFCVGRNYAAHAREMGKDPEREFPFFFMKPTDAVVDDGEMVTYPPRTSNFQYEAELVVAIGKEAIDTPVESALEHVWGYAIGNDLTRRDIQMEARDKGRPWDEGKAFDRSAVIGPLHPVSAVGHLSSGSISLNVNGDTKQDADLKDLIWSVPEIISILSHSFALKPGDIIMTGTPAGVGPLLPGDVCIVSIEGLGQLSTRVEKAKQ
ncbi:fumarylacetoacetate hydrolase family protein [Mesorhizobium sp. YR577]|uniref:fumarylacetoacetate hydrolase family protein n=1 Tax=Mesorhizobium sp. YR577 TaxID=1884373 RepID=UPI0008EFF631|nr:fumarylacetoacetate hydrolase family protein [Mesorhizobium sp. YR577]SFU21930.1 fumarylpyruvate hydrolase [Mesorhizobium sp. YR577]